MKTPVLNNHLKKQYILLGKKSDICKVVEDLKIQGETVRYSCCVDCNDERYISIEQCVSICSSDGAIDVWTVSDECETWIEELRNNGICVMNYYDMFEGVKNRACHFEEMYIDRYGTVHCCCKTYLKNIIGNLKDWDIHKKIVEFSPENSCVCAKGRLTSNAQLEIPKIPELASIELSSQCNAQCTYCFQNDETKGSAYEYYDELFDLIQKLKLNKLIFAGGEILIQPESISFIRRLRCTNPGMWIHLKSNGCHELEHISIVEELFDSITITLNGFGTSTVSTIMRVPFERTKQFCEKICERDDLMVGIKFLTSPANICEMPEFLEWCIALHPDRIVIPSARIYDCNEESPDEWLGSTFNGLNRAYWNPIFSRIGARIIKMLKSNFGEDIILQIDTELQELLGISEAVKEFSNGS